MIGIANQMVLGNVSIVEKQKYSKGLMDFICLFGKKRSKTELLYQVRKDILKGKAFKTRVRFSPATPEAHIDGHIVRSSQLRHDTSRQIVLNDCVFLMWQTWLRLGEIE